MTTYRERREARAERLREWASKREATATAVFEANRAYTSDYAFNTQPGHIPARARIIAQEDRQRESLRKAGEMRQRADGIESQAEHAIYSDDPDAIERLRERIASLESERDTIKAENAAFRKAHRAELAGMTTYERSQAMPHPSFRLTNLSGNIKRNRDRLAELERQSQASGVPMTVCAIETCGAVFCVVEGREFPSLCNDHAEDASRERHGWTPGNSRD